MVQFSSLNLFGSLSSPNGFNTRSCLSYLPVTVIKCFESKNEKDEGLIWLMVWECSLSWWRSRSWRSLRQLIPLHPPWWNKREECCGQLLFSLFTQSRSPAMEWTTHISGRSSHLSLPNLETSLHLLGYSRSWQVDSISHHSYIVRTYLKNQQHKIAQELYSMVCCKDDQ